MALVVPANAGDIKDVGSIPGLGRSPGGGHGNPLQCSCLDNLHGQRNPEGWPGTRETDDHSDAGTNYPWGAD